MRTALALGWIAGMLVLDSVAVSTDKQPTFLAQFKRDDLGSEAYRYQAANARTQQEEALRNVERMRNLPPHAVAAVANGVVSFEDLAFAEDGTLIDNGVIPATKLERDDGAPTQKGLLGLRIGVAFSGSFLLLAAWFMKRRRTANPLRALDMEAVERKLYSLDADHEAGPEVRPR